MAAIILSVVLFITGIAIGFEALKNIVQGNYGDLEVPGILALAAALVSIITKEAMFWYTKSCARKIDSSALMADAWHHRSDAFSSIGALVGIGGARLGYPVMDSIASLVIFGFIVKAAYDIFKDAIDKMVDHSCDEETEKQVVKGDRELIKRMLENLIGNAICHNPKGCYIVVRLQKDKRLIIADNGCGVTKEQLRSMRKPLFMETLGEHGLGIRLVKRIVKLHHWRICFRENDGSGLWCEIEMRGWRRVK